MCVVIEFAGRGTLTGILEDKEMTWDRARRQWMEDTACGLAYLHGLSPMVIHRDIKPDNILIAASLTAKLADLGASRRTELTEKEVQTMTRVGTPLFAAPEVFTG